MGLPIACRAGLISHGERLGEPLACVGFGSDGAHEIVGYIIPDLEKVIVILSMNRTNRNEELESSLVGRASIPWHRCPYVNQLSLCYRIFSYQFFRNRSPDHGPDHDARYSNIK